MTGSKPGSGGSTGGAEPPDDEKAEPLDAGLAVVYHLPFGTDPDTAGTVSGDGTVSGSSSVATAEAAVDGSAGADDRGDWAWVQEWRAGQEPTPWVTGVPLAVFAALVVGVAVWVLSAGLADRPVVAVLVNLLVAGGLAPAMWLSRNLPVLRWIAAGSAAGIVLGWISAILLLPLSAD